MKNNWFNNKYATIALYAFFAMAAVVLFIFAVLNFPWFLSLCVEFLGIIKSFIIGFVIAYLINPGYRFFREKVYGKLFKKKPFPRTTKILSIVTVYILALSAISFLLWIVVPQFVSSISRLVNNFENYYNSFSAWLAHITNGNADANQLLLSGTKWFTDYITNLKLDDFVHIKDITVSITSGIFDFLVGIIISVYMLYNKELFCAQAKKVGYALFSKKFMYKLQRLFGTSHITFGKYLSGVLIDAFVVGVVCFVVMQIVGIPYAVLIGVIIGITNMIPFFGPFIGGIPSVLLVLLVEPENPLKAVWCGVILIILQQIDGNFIAPKIVGQKTGISAIWVIFAILIGGGFFGVAGMVLGVPVFSVAYVFAKEIINERLKEKNMTSDTRKYFATADVSDKYLKQEKNEE
ncbi:MAG: AI-2E family transporter [Clostridia bacterium]|nr:AI-2E family transporter [Clostridia bacterium]